VQGKTATEKGKVLSNPTTQARHRGPGKQSLGHGFKRNADCQRVPTRTDEGDGALVELFTGWRGRAEVQSQVQTGGGTGGAPYSFIG